MTTDAPAPGVPPGALLGPLWTRWRFWLAVLAALVLAATLIGLLGESPGRPLDPASARPDGSRALARLLAGYGTRVVPTRDPGVHGAVVVTEPDAFSVAQLRGLARRSPHLVLVAPGLRATRAVLPGVEPGAASVGGDPSCGYAGAVAAGPVDLPAGTVGYQRADGRASHAVRCYRGALVVTSRVTVVGSPGLFENRYLDRRGVAALAVDVVGSDRTVARVSWLTPGASAAGGGGVTIWTLFPPGARRVAVWLLVVGVLAVLWRARRLGPAVREPLPVVVRSAEIVEGHGRLYQRAGARDRAAAALQQASAARLAARLSLPRGTPPTALAAALSARLGRPAGEIWAALAGPPPADDTGLTTLAGELERLEAATTRGTTP